MAAQGSEAVAGPSFPRKGLVGANEVMGANAGKFRSAVEHLVGSRDKSRAGAASRGRKSVTAGRDARQRPGAATAAPSFASAPPRRGSSDGSGTGFGPDHVATCEMIFAILDHDQDGLLETDQLRTAITALGVPPSRRVMQEVQNAAPLFVAPRVGLETFITAMRRHLAREPVPTKDIRAALAAVSTGAGGGDGSGAVPGPRADSGTVSLGEIRHALCGVHTSNRTHLSERDADDLLKDLGYAVPGTAAADAGPEVDVDSFIATINSGFARLGE